MIIIEIAGFLGADPEKRFTANGKPVVTLRVATRVHEGGQDETVWWSVNVWDDRYSKMISHLKKGSAVIVVGKMARKPKTYTARDGTVQISLNMNADIIEFSPFGKPGERTSESVSHHTSHAEPEDPFAASSHSSYGTTSSEYAGAGASQDHSFAGDDLPF